MLRPSNNLQASYSLIANVCCRHILDEMLLTIASCPPQEPRNNVCLDGMSEPTGVGDCADHIFRFFERNLNSLSPQFLIRIECFFHGVGLALLDPACEASREEDGVFEDDTCALALRRHGMLG